jgi:hypothetical protein
MKILHKARQILFCSMALASLFAVLAFTPAHAAATTSRAVVPNVASVACTKTDGEIIYTANQTHGSEVRQIQLWYSPSSRCVWAREINGQVDDYILVDNIDTGDFEYLYLSGSSGQTAPINDAGTQSEACMLPYYVNGTYTGGYICTSPF